MAYTVGEMAKRLGVPASTLRYYDKEGLLPQVERSPGGIRMFQKSDYEWLRMIGCMKKAGMSIRDIRHYIQLSAQGDDTIGDRLEMFRNQREVLCRRIEEMQHTLETVEYKCWFYETAREAGTVQAPKSMTEQRSRSASGPSGGSLRENNRKNSERLRPFRPEALCYVRSLKVLGARR